MPAFPTLRTGAVAQYPLEQSLHSPAESVRFLDGGRQSYPLTGRALRRWAIRAELLDEAEIAAIAAFAEINAGAVFAFTDPAGGEVAAQCVIAGERFRSGIDSRTEGWSELSIEEVL